MLEFPESLELFVIQVIKGAWRSREVLEAEYADLVPEPWEEERVALYNFSSIVHRQGMLLAHLSVVPATRGELMARMPGLLDAAPAWLDASVRGEQTMTADLFARGIAQTLTVHRVEIERVVEQQVSEPAPIRELLDQAPVPAGHPGVSMDAVAQVMMVHTQALCEIAHDLETQFR